MRNKAVHGGFKPAGEELERAFQRNFHEHWMIMSKNHHVPPSSTVSVTHWNNPTRERTKINCDAAVGKFDSAIAMIARDWRGNLVFACSIKVNTNIPVQVEAEALRWAVSTAMNHKLINVSFERDCQVCIQSLTSSSNSIPWRVSDILQETIS